MSRVVDERVVSMQFDNRQFERNISNTMSTLEKFNGNLGGLGTAVEKVGSKFSAMEVMAVTALANITNSAVNAGKRIVSALTIEPVKTGFNEYELKMGSIQTIMAGTGESLETVNKYLEELNEYSDKTIYSFADMTNNIGKFTNAGVKLEDAVAAIKGVSNVAAVSGANTNEASRAMYNFAQALSSGYVKLVDWKSIELANMGTVEFKQQLIDAAVAAGTLTKTADGMYKTLEGHTFNATKGFNDNLQDQWMTTEVLVNTLRDYADETTEIGKKASKAATEIKTLTMLFDTLKESAQSGWAQTWEILVGDFEEAKVLWTDVNNAISPILDSMAKSRNELLTTWKDLGGRTKLIEALRAAFEGVMNVGSTLKEAFRDIFKPMKPEQLVKASQGLLDMANAFKAFTENTEVMGKIKSFAKDIFSIAQGILSIFRSAFTGVVNIAKSVKTAFGEIFASFDSSPLLTLSADLKMFAARLKGLAENAEVMDKFRRIAKGAFAVIDIGVEIVTELGSALKSLIKYIFPVGDGVVTLGAGLGDALVILRDWIKSTNIFGKTFGWIAGVIGSVINGFKKALKFIKDCFTNWTGIEISFSTFVDRFKARLASVTQIGEWFKKVFSSLGKSLGTTEKVTSAATSGISESIKTFFSNLGETIKNAFKDADFNTGLDLMNTGLLGGILFGVARFISAFTKTTKNADGLLGTIKGFIETLTKVFKEGGFKEIKKLLGDVAKDVLAPVKEALTSWQKSLKAEILLKIAKAIAILAAALFVLALLDSKKLAVALAAITGLFLDLFASMAIFEKVSGKTDFGKLGITLIAVSSAMLIMAFAMRTVAKLDWAGVAKATVGIAAMSSVMVGFTAMLGLLSKKLATTEKQTARMSKMVGQIIGLSVALLLMSWACRSIAKLSWEDLAKGLLGMGIALVGVAAALKLMPKNSALSAGGVVVAAVGLLALAGVLAVIGTLDWDDLAKGLVAIGGCLVLLAGGLHAMKKTGAGSAALLVASVAISIFALALRSFSKLEWDGLAKGLIAIGGSLVLLGVGLQLMRGTLGSSAALVVAALALAILAPVLKLFGSMSLGEIAKGLLVVAGAFAILGVAGAVLTPLAPVILLLAGSIALIGVGCMAAAVGITMFAAGLAALAVSLGSLGIGVTAFVTSLISTIPLVLQKVGEGIVAIVTVIGNSAQQIFEAVKNVLSSLLGALAATVPQFVEVIVGLIVKILTVLNENMPRIVEMGMKILISLIEGIAANIERLTMAAVDLINNFLNGIRNKFPEIIQTAVDLVISFVNGIAAAIENNAAPMTQAVINVVKSVIKAVFSSLKTFRTEFKEAGKDLLSGFVNGIKSKVTDAANAARDIGKKALNSIKDFLGINSPSKELFAVGVYADEGLIKGMDSLGGDVADSAEGVADNALGSFANILSGLKDSINGEVECEPTITPVIDMSKFNSGLAQIKNKLANTGVLNVATNNAKAQEVSRSVNGDSGVQNGTAKAAAGNVFNYTQNNYSPKPLSRIDIYRQTQNQFSTMERMVALK